MWEKACKEKRIFWIYFTLLFLIVVVKLYGFHSIDDILMLRESITLARQEGYWNINLNIFHSIGPQLRHLPSRWAIANLVGNFVPFIPLGYLLPTAYPKLQKKILLGMSIILIIVGIEGFQFVTKLGVFDIDDIILNSIGAMSGSVLFYIKRSKRW